MLTNRLYLLAIACALPFSVVACGGGDGDDDPITPEGTHHGYVVSKASVVPGPGQTAASLGIDLGGPKSAELNGTVDNQLGTALAGLSAFFNVQGTVDTAVANGGILLLLDFQTKDFTNASASGFSVKFGANPMPMPCTTPTDCGKHLAGTGSFTIATNSPTDASLAGKVASGTFEGGPGSASVQIAIGSTAAIPIELHRARVKATGLSDTGMTAIIGGLLTVSDLMTKVGPAIQASVMAIVTADCGTGGSPPECGCPSDSTGALVIRLADGNLPGGVKDCAVSVAELLNINVVAAVLQPDSCSQDTCTASDSLSVGVKVEAVKATFPGL